MASDRGTRRLSIQAKLFAALAVIFSTTVAAGLVAYFGFMQVAATIDNIVDRQSPIMTTALQLQADSGALVAAAPAFIAARDAAALGNASEALKAEREKVYARLDALAAQGGDSERVAALRGKVDDQVAALQRLQDEVGARNAMLGDLRNQVGGLREKQRTLASLLSDQVASARSDLVVAAENAAESTSQTIKSLLDNEFTQLRMAMSVNSDIKNAAVLLMRGAYAESPATIDDLQGEFQATVDHLEPRLDELKQVVDLGLLPILVQSSLDYGVGSNSIFELRRAYVRNQSDDEQVQRIFTGQRDKMIHDVQATLDDADATISDVVDRASSGLRESANAAIAKNSDTIQQLVNVDLDTVTTLLELRAEVSAMVGLLTTGATVQAADQLPALEQRYASRVEAANAALAALPAARQEALRAKYAALRAMGQGDDGIFALRGRSLAATGDATAALADSRGIAQALSTSVGALVDDARAGMSAAAASSKAALDRSVLLLVGIVGASFLVAVGVAFGYVRHRITRPLMEKTEAMRALANEDLDVAIEGTQRGDEIGGMARALAFFKDSLKRNQELVTEQQAEAERKAAEARSLQAATTRFRGSAEDAVGGVKTQVEYIRGTVAASGMRLESAGAQSFEVAEAAQRTEGNVGVVADSVQELVRSSREIGARVEESTQVAGNAVDQVTSTNKKIQGLSEAADKIGDVVRMIQDIAEQTNLLALNATIEAARAGEAGRGFAVVANEVKNLANQTARATEDISNQVRGIQDATQDAVNEVESIGATIRNIDEISTRVAAAVEEQSTATQQISDNTQTLATDATTVKSHVGMMIRASAESASQSYTMLWAAEDIDGLIGTMNETVGDFIDAVTDASGSREATPGARSAAA